MIKICNFEISDDLKKNGYTQPFPDECQFWYDPKDKALIVITQVEDSETVFWTTIGKAYDSGYFKVNQISEFIYAPNEAELAAHKSIKVTDEEISAIEDAANILKGGIGCGEDSKRWSSLAKIIKKMLKTNGL